MINWFKNIFKNPLDLVRRAIDSLDYLAPELAAQMEKAKAEFNKKTPLEQAQWMIDKVQAYLKKQWKL